MKKSIIIIMLLVFTCSTIKAQEPVSFGIKGGINFTNINFSNFSGSNSRTGFHFGFLAEIPLEQKWSIQQELIYSTQGSDIKLNIAGENAIVAYNLDYIQLPVIIKWYLTTSLSLDAGPSLNFLINEDISDLDRKIVRNFEFGGAFGVSYKISGNFFGSARYTYGLTQVFEKEFYEGSANNYGFQAGAGFKF